MNIYLSPHKIKINLFLPEMSCIIILVAENGEFWGILPVTKVSKRSRPAQNKHKIDLAFILDRPIFRDLYQPLPLSHIIFTWLSIINDCKWSLNGMWP